MYLLNESNFRKRFPACTKELKRRATLGQIGTPNSEKGPAASAIGLEALDIKEVETVTGVLDIKGVGLMSFWKVKDLLTQVIQISDVSLCDLSQLFLRLTLCQNYYPETSNRMVSRLDSVPARSC